jgi:hypothetical protein
MPVAEKHKCNAENENSEFTFFEWSCKERQAVILVNRLIFKVRANHFKENKRYWHVSFRKLCCM